MKTVPSTTPEVHRDLAVSLFNQVWELIRTANRTVEQDDEMLHSAHASCYHWSKVGQPKNFARGEWQVSRVYAVMGRAEPCRWHAARCLAHCESANLGSFDFAYAHEALGRAAMVATDWDQVEVQRAEAEKLASEITDEEHRGWLTADLATLIRTVG